MERRIKILQFKKQFYNNQNTALPLLLQKEKSGILNWLIEGYKKIDKKKPIEMPEELKHLSKKLHAETIEKGNMLIERYLIKDERHLITPQQAMFLMRNTKAYGFKGIKYEDYQPRFLAVALKKYASEIEEFSSKMQKFYIGVGISNEAYAYDVQDTINMSDSPLELGLESTNIEEQIRHHRAWVEFLTKKLEEDPEDKITQLKLKEYTTYLEFLLNYEKILNDKYNIEAEETQENNYYNIENSSDKATKTA